MAKQTVMHYCGAGVHCQLPGWAVCSSGDLAYKIKENGNQTHDINAVTCKKCLKIMKGTRAEQRNTCNHEWLNFSDGDVCRRCNLVVRKPNSVE